MVVKSKGEGIMQKAIWTGAAAIALAFAGHGASAKTKDVEVYSFCAHDGGSCLDGWSPQGGLARDADGNFYGTTFIGGTHNNSGVIYELSPKDDHRKYTKLYDFCAVQNCGDGGQSGSSLIVDVNGNLYGTTLYGAGNSGTVFELSPNARRTRWKLKTLFIFGTQNGLADGYYPYGHSLTYAGAASGAPYDGVSPLYGVTEYGGNDLDNLGNFGFGVAFKLTPGRKAWKETVLRTFCSEGGTDCTDGGAPSGGLLMDDAGNLFGGLSVGGTSVGGTIYELSPNGGGWTFTTLHNFCSAANCTDGRTPNGEPIFDTNGSLLDTTGSGGANNFGTIFRLVPNGTSSQEDVLYNFCATSGCPDGGFPNSTLTRDPSGALYGATGAGGHGGNGILFRYKSGSEKVILSFCQKALCRDGMMPSGPAIFDDGRLYFETVQGGKADKGGVFYVTP